MSAPPPPEATDQQERQAVALDELLDLHSASPVVGLCRECLLPAPCRTLELARVIAGTPTPPEKESQ